MSQENEQEEIERKDLSAFFGDDEPEETPEPAPADEADPAPAEADSEQSDDAPVRNEKGQFVKKDAAKGETAQGDGAAKPGKEKSDERVPASVVAELRQKIRDLEAQRNEPGRNPQPNQQGQAGQPKAPDPIDDPQGYTAYLENQVQMRVLNERLNLSEMMARQQAGDEAVDGALEAYQQAAASNPSLAYQLAQSRNPYGELLSWHRKQQAMAEVGEDPEAYRERVRQELMAELQGQAPAQPARPKASPPPSLAKGGTNSAPSNELGEDDAFLSVFRK